MKRLKNKILLILNIAAALSLLLAYASVVINPEKITFPAFFGLAYPYLLLLNIFFVVIWAVNFKKEALISIVVIVIGLNHLNNYIRFRSNETGEYDFRLLSYNVRLFNHYDSDKNSDKNITDYLAAQDPEILCLQEFYLHGDTSGAGERFAKQLDKDYYIHTKFVPIRDELYYGIVTLSLYPVAGRGDILHPRSASLSIYTDIIIETDTFRIYNNHLQSFKLRRMERSMIEEIYGNDQTEAMKEIRELSFSLKKGFAGRARQAMILKEHIDGSPYPVIVCGDFNDTPVSYTYRKIRKNLKDAFVESGSGAGFTYKGKYPSNRIDYILFNNRLVSAGFKIDRVGYSDHYPITGYFRLSN